VSDLLVGVWELLSFERRTADGKVDFPFGQKVCGLLIYTKSGRISVHLSAGERAPFRSNDMWEGTLEEMRGAIATYNAYFGRYEVDVTERVVRHHIEGCVVPNWIGGVQERRFLLQGDELTLSTPPIQAGGLTAEAMLVWRRVSDGASGS
jgi:hypothetical protein